MSKVWASYMQPPANVSHIWVCFQWKPPVFLLLFLSHVALGLKVKVQRLKFKVAHVEQFKMATLQKVLQKVLFPRSGLLGLPAGLDSRVILCRHVASCNYTHRYRPEACRGLCTPAVEPESERMMPFEEYRKLRKALKWRARIAGIPMGLLGIAASSFVNVHFNPRMFEMSPEEIKPIL